MNIMIYIVIFLLLITKFFDLHSTIIRNCENETNPVFRLLPKFIGKKARAYLIAFLAFFIIILVGTEMINTDSFLFKLLFVLIGIAISIIQMIVALKNYGICDKYKIISYVTEIIEQKYKKIEQKIY
ncbi:MAG: hypothetical protein N2999_05805 [Proteobacteria bacterium]|nr:hypothetical protein [Pseudomonadota bacterium]